MDSFYQRSQKQGETSHGPGDGIHGRRDRYLGRGAPFPPLLRRYHPRQLPLATRPEPTRQAPLRRRFGRSPLVSLVWFLLQPSFLSPNVIRLCFHGLRSEPLWYNYLHLELWIPHRLPCIYMSGDAWKEGGIDATGALMVLTLKVISCAINYNDGLLKEEGLRESQKKNRLIKLPSLIEYFGYCLCCGSHFAGPVYEIKDYLDWSEGKGIWSHSEEGLSPSPYGATIRALLQAAFCMALYLYLVPQFPLSRFTDPIYQEWGFWKRLGYQYMSGFTARWKYYFIWSISEASIILSGLGFTGWTESSKPRWDRAKNVDILGVEFAKSSVQLPLVWNIQVSTWLRHYVYERLVKPGKKAGFFQLLTTQTVSAVWHGLYPGYIIFFVQSALMIAGSRVIYRWQQAVPQNMDAVKNILVFINFAYTLLVLNYSCVGFIVLSLRETLASYGSVHFIGTILPIALILLSYVIKPPRPARSKARKEE
ncbi:hypothetical protein Pyn_25780 [Prunus yedoensis var. nudiflora]|uniref:Lysophospholipid acyltransferase 1 n=1 Tax=Prunus yedoensis var. nudiflora TaxID=2094558 RepID=A0A314ZN50_PRUYE|nr:hypothetical protein Pyn_25780 [Prunus yedoensis var. nudiflora]